MPTRFSFSGPSEMIRSVAEESVTALDPMPILGHVDRAAALAGGAMELAGVSVVLLGAVLTTVVFLRRLGDGKATEAWQDYRNDLGRAILLGLEFLVAADIIGTVAVDPSFRSLGGLGLLVLVRTFLSFILEMEITGRWPWQKDRPGRPSGLDPGAGREPSPNRP